MAQTPGHQPLFYRVEEAAEILRISRSTAYEMANTWLRTNGTDGLPCIRLGRRLVVPRAVIDDWATLGARGNEPSALT
jgi:excisionase family DNA binding protein